MKPVVTFGICVKNEEANVRDALESVLSQDYPHELMQVIVVDGCSSDRTVEIIEKTLHGVDIDHRIFLEDNGLGYARQMVVDNAKGNYIVWVDGDLKLSKDYTKKQVEFMEKNRNVGIAAARYGLCSGSLVATLENFAYLVDSFRWSGKEYQRLPPTEGSFFRVEAVRQVGGFDKGMKGACEDIEVAYKIKTKGWLFHMTTAIFYEKCKDTWKGLWNQYSWWGYGGHYLFHKDRRINPVYEMVPQAGFIAGLMRISASYKITFRKISFLLPVHCAFKRMAWTFGFMKSHLDGYGHKV